MSYPNPLFRVSYADLQNTKRAFADQESKFCDVYFLLILSVSRYDTNFTKAS